MTRVASRRHAKPVAKAVTSNPISRYTRLSKGPVVAASKSDRKVLGTCLANNSRTPKLAQVQTHDGSDRENHEVIALRASYEADLSKPVNQKKRKARTDDEILSTVEQPDYHKRQRVQKDTPKSEVHILPLPSAAVTLNSCNATNLARKTIAVEVRRKSHQTTLIKEAKEGGRKASRHLQKKQPKIPKASQLPKELLDLLELQRVILKTVVLQIAHQNSHCPIDISAITPQVSRTWGKRKVTVDDIRRCIAIQNMKPSNHDGSVETLSSPFIVTDYGRGKLCLELDTSNGTGPINERGLCKQFEENLHLLCTERTTDEMCDLDVSFESLSFNDLPKADITVRHDAFSARQNPLLAKGYRALTTLKNDMMARQQEKETKTSNAIVNTMNPDGSKMSLLDRLRAKEAAKAQLQVPSGPELARQRASQRVGDVASIIGMLASSSNPMGMPVLSYTMAALQQKLKDSLRVPMPTEEGIDTVKLLANEVAPEWLRVVNMSGKEHVVIQTKRKPYDSDIMARVGRLHI